MSHHDRALVLGALAVVVLAGIGAAVHLVPWLRDNRTDISLILLMLLPTASGFTAALALIIPYADRPTRAEDLDGADDNADDDADTDADTGMVCPQCGGSHGQTQKPITADDERLCDGCHAPTALFNSPLPAGRNPQHDDSDDSDDSDLQHRNPRDHRGCRR